MNALSAEDELQIRALVARCADAACRFDAPEWASTWSADGKWEIGQRTVSGREAIVELWKEIRGRSGDRLVQLVGQGRVWPVPGGAEGTWTFMEIARKTGEEQDHLEHFCYSDRYVREDGQWLLAQRRFSLNYRGWLTAGEFFPQSTRS